MAGKKNTQGSRHPCQPHCACRQPQTELKEKFTI